MALFFAQSSFHAFHPMRLLSEADMFKHNCLVRFGIAFCLLLGGIQAAQIVRPGTVAAARRELQKSMQAGSGIVLAIASDKAGSADDEAYGDWADNFKSFINSAPAEIRVIRLTLFLYERLLLSPKLKRCPATVFIRDQTHALVYDARWSSPGSTSWALTLLRPDESRGIFRHLSQRIKRISTMKD